jgi:hypothetical protein
MNTKKIAEYRKLLNVDKNVTLKELKTIYRNSMKEDHPDTIADVNERLIAEERSKNVIEAYHFLVSIAPETQEKVKEAYEATIKNFNIQDFYMDNTVLYINFLDGSQFEYFGVPKNIYVKMSISQSNNKLKGVQEI